MFEPALYWIKDVAPHRLALMARPRGADWLADEVAGWRRAGVDCVVSLLEAPEIRELELEQERVLCEQAGIDFHEFPIKDRGVPGSVHKLTPLLETLYERLKAGGIVAIHCRAGIGRTGLVAGCLLHMLGVPYKGIFPMLSRGRGLMMPDTDEQATWVQRFAARRVV